MHARAQQHTGDFVRPGWSFTRWRGDVGPFPETTSSLDSHLEWRRASEVIKSEECLEPSLLVLPFIAVTQGVYRMEGGEKQKQEEQDLFPNI